MTKVLVQGGLAIGVVGAILWLFLFAPHYIEAWQMRHVVGTGALTWAAFDQVRSKNDMIHEINKLELDDIIIDDCTFEESGGNKTVSCKWVVDVEIPLIGQKRRLRFDVTETATPDQRLAD
jgi:hypothetical protein